MTGVSHAASQAGMQEQALVCGDQGEGAWLQLLWVTWAADYVINCSSFLREKREALFGRQVMGKWQTTTLTLSLL